MGKIYVTDIDNPKSAFAYVGCFGFYAGESEKELVINRPDGFVIMIPQNESWAKLIEECFGEAEYLRLYNAGALSAEVLNDIRNNGLNNKRK